MLQCYHHQFRAFCVIANSWRWTQQVFFAQMTPCAVRHDVIYHPFPINSQYLKTSGVDSTAIFKVKCNDSVSLPFLFPCFLLLFVKDQIASFQLKQIVVFSN